MNCYLPWKLTDMTGISAEKLQRNINQQVSYLGLYKGELVKEAFKFNIASILKYVCNHRSSFGTDALSRKATDCLIVFLHSMALQRDAFFTPTDSETSIQAKGCRNLHRLMLEDLKATMRYIDYSVLLDRANGSTSVSEMMERREAVYSKVFPDEVLMDVCGVESINDAFFSIIDVENSGNGNFIDYDVKNIASLDDSLCDMLSISSSSQDGFGGDSKYGIIGDMAKYLDTPFIRHSGRCYSFVTRFALGRIHDRIAALYPSKDESSDAVAVETVDDATDDEYASDDLAGDGTADEPVVGEVLGAEPPAVEDEPVELEEPKDDVIEDDELDEFDDRSAFDEGAMCWKEPSQETVDEYEDESEEYDEPLDEFLPLDGGDGEVGASSVQPYGSDAVQHDDFLPVDGYGTADSREGQDPCDDDSADGELVDDDLVDADPADDDSYSYLDDVPSDEFSSNPMLKDPDSPYDDDMDDEQDCADRDGEPCEVGDEASCNETESLDDPYSERSLFDSFDDDETSDSNEGQEEAPSSYDALAEDEIQESNDTQLEGNDVLQEGQCTVNEAQCQECAIADEPSQVQDTPVNESVEEAKPSDEGQGLDEKPAIDDAPAMEDKPDVQASKRGEDSLLDKVLKPFSGSNPIVQYVEQCSDEQRLELCRFMEKAIEACRADGRDKMFAIPDTAISVCVFQTTKDPMLEIQRKENVGALMFADGRDVWNSLELYVNDLGSLVKSDYRKITRFSFSDWEWKIVEKLGQRIVSRRGR